MRQELNGVKAELTEVKETLKGVVAGIGELKGAVAGIGELKDVVLRVAATAASTQADLADFKDYAKKNFVTKDEFHGRMDGFARRFDILDLRLAHHGERLTDLESRGRS